MVQRGTTHIIGRLLKENGVWVVAPEDKRISQDILVQGAVGKAKSGQIVSVELTEQPGRFKQPSGKIVEVLGDMDDPGMEIEIAVRKFGVPHIFSDAALKQAAKLPDVVRESDWGERVDLSSLANAEFARRRLMKAFCRRSSATAASPLSRLRYDQSAGAVWR